MRRLWIASILAAALMAVVTAPLAAQTGDGSLRGYVKEDQGGVLPGVTVMAHSTALLAPGRL
jgi:hypothetical protein